VRLRAPGVTAVAVDEFGLPAQRASITRAGMRCPPMAVDTHGADVTALDDIAGVGGVLLTASHQFPLGMPLHSDRRAAVVDWARRTGSVIIEDDYDGEFRYNRSPVGALHGVDPDHVIYMGRASTSLAPGLRLGWLVLPERLVEPVVRQKGEPEETPVSSNSWRWPSSSRPAPTTGISLDARRISAPP
jgi:GntR family transcriptional regulator / MocR family aminotransferase